VPRTPSQYVLVALTVAFAGLQFLPHFMTTLVGSWLDLCYWAVGLVLLFITITSAGLTLFVGGLSSESDIQRVCWSWFLTLTMMIGITAVMSLENFTFHRGLPTGSFARRFDQSVWMRDESSHGAGGDITNRQKMLGDVIRSVVVNGTKESITECLGSPDSGVFSSLNPGLLYITGPQRDSFFAIDSEWLLIWFDENGRTLRYEIRSD